MGKEQKKELIERIKDLTTNYEESYTSKEWEHFQHYRIAKRRKSVPLFVKLSGIAASLSLMVYASVKLITFVQNDRPIISQTEHRTIQQQKVVKGNEQEILAEDSIINLIDSNAKTEQKIQKQLPAIQKVNNLQITEELIPAKTLFTTMPIPLMVKDSLDPHINFHKLDTIPRLASATPSISDQKKKNHAIFSSQHIGFNLTPIITDQGISFGGGVSKIIPIADRLEAEIGISYSNIVIGNNWKPDDIDTISKKLAGVKNSLHTVSIPLSIRYKISESFALGVGVSPFRVLSGKRTDVHTSSRWQYGINSSGDSTKRLIDEINQSYHSDTVYRNRNYLGFLQVYGHISPPLLQRHRIIISPYMGIPLGRLRDDRYRWLNGGVSLRMYLR